MRMDIVIAPDHKYVMPAEVLIKSIIENNKEHELAIHVIKDSTITDEDMCKLNTFSCGNVQILYHEIDEKEFARFSKIGNLPNVVYYRLFLSSILNNSIKKALYLDCDIVVDGNLSVLFGLNNEKVGISAVLDARSNGESKRLKMPFSLGYFNSGVMFINLDFWRRNNVEQLFVGILENKDSRLVYYDQDVLNIVFGKSKTILPIEYNFQTISKSLVHPIIIHFTQGNAKPWNNSKIHPYADIWFKYNKMLEDIK
jgi:lipopolysaccharide biosynthesis glycosyltransferase